MANSPFTSQTKLFLTVAPGLCLHSLEDGHIWVESVQGLFSPIHLGSRHEAPDLASDAALPAMQAVMRLAQIQPELTEALKAIESDARTVFVPAPGYKVLASHAEAPRSEKGWFVEDSFEQFTASDDHESAWEACVAAVEHHLASEPSLQSVREAAAEHVADDNRVVLAPGGKVEREPGNPYRGAWVSARVWVKDADTSSKATPDEIAAVSV